MSNTLADFFSFGWRFELIKGCKNNFQMSFESVRFSKSNEKIIEKRSVLFQMNIILRSTKF
jgi:hypothetical protein